MAKLEDYRIPRRLYYHKEHIWADVENGDRVRVGGTDFAQKSAGDVVYVDLPFVGDEFEQDEPFGKMQSAKWIGNLYSPVGGVVEEINEELNRTPSLVNKDPYGAGWIILMKATNLSKDLENLMHGEAVLEWMKEEIKKAEEEDYAGKIETAKEGE